MATSIILSKKQKKKETVIFTILCILIVILLIANIWAFIYIVNGGTRYGSPSFMSDNKRVIGHVLDNQKATNDILTLDDDETLNPGSVTYRSIQIENYGNQELYLRMYCEFQVSIDNENFETKDFIDLIVDNADENWIKSSIDNKYYSTVSLGGNSTINMDIELMLKPELGTDDLYDEYRTCHYKLFIHIETLNSNGITINKTSEAIADSWK